MLKELRRLRYVPEAGAEGGSALGPPKAAKASTTHAHTVEQLLDVLLTERLRTSEAELEAALREASLGEPPSKGVSTPEALHMCGSLDTATQMLENE